MAVDVKKPASKQEYEAALSKARGTRVALTDQQYQQLLAGKLLTDSQLAQAEAAASGVNPLMEPGFESRPGAYMMPATGNQAVPAKFAAYEWWQDPSQQWQPYQGKVATSSKPAPDMAKANGGAPKGDKTPKDPTRYAGFEDDAENVGGMSASAPATYAAAFGTPADKAAMGAAFDDHVATWGARRAPVAAPQWQQGNSLSALDYARSMGTRASNRARWDDTQNRWVTEFEDLGLTPGGMPKGGALGRTFRQTEKK